MDNNKYGKELILDIHKCNPNMFNRENIKMFFQELCEKIDMEKCEYYFWDDEGVPENEKQTEPHLKGTSAIQFIKTSNITIHTLDILKQVYLNIFSCKDFDAEIVKKIVLKYFEGIIVNQHLIERI